MLRECVQCGTIANADATVCPHCGAPIEHEEITMTDPSDKITATDDPELAQRHGLTKWDEELGQYVAPTDEERAAGDRATTDPDGSTNKTVGRGTSAPATEKTTGSTSSKSHK